MIRTLLREVCNHSTTALQWRAEDVARAQYRLSLLLRRQNRPREATQYEEKANSLREEYTAMLPKKSTPPTQEPMDEEAKMALFDSDVSCWHGRTAGIWRAGDYW